LQAQSIIADCPPYGDYSSAIPSEMSSILLYTENGGFPQLLLDPNTGASGGQQTGADSSGRCYGGIYTHSPYIFEAQNLMQACDSSVVTFTLYLQDLYTNQTISEQLIIQYIDTTDSTYCTPFLQLSNTFNTRDYIAADSIYSNAYNTFNNTVNLQAAHRIKLTNGFRSGINFSAQIDSCQ